MLNRLLNRSGVKAKNGIIDAEFEIIDDVQNHQYSSKKSLEILSENTPSSFQMVDNQASHRFNKITSYDTGRLFWAQRGVQKNLSYEQDESSLNHYKSKLLSSM